MKIVGSEEIRNMRNLEKRLDYTFCVCVCVFVHTCWHFPAVAICPGILEEWLVICFSIFQS